MAIYQFLPLEILKFISETGFCDKFCFFLKKHLTNLFTNFQGSSYLIVISQKNDQICFNNYCRVKITHKSIKQMAVNSTQC